MRLQFPKDDEFTFMTLSGSKVLRDGLLEKCFFLGGGGGEEKKFVQVI